MKEEELEERVISVTPERLRGLASELRVASRPGRPKVVLVRALVTALTAGLDTGDKAEKVRASRRVRDAVLATVERMPDATYHRGT